MTYEETVSYLYNQTPQFQQIGAAAYKPGLDTVKRLSAMFGNPEKRLRTIHVGGTNGKGSTSHTLAAMLQCAGYKVGLFTSPHLVDFRERIRVNGEKIPQSAVVDFVERFLKANNEAATEPSFFELTTVMAFDWFARNDVDFAVIEVGLGGRLDSTNIITPMLSVVTNISFDHTAQLGNTLAQIASEKAGIFKPGVPALVGEATGEVRRVFTERAAAVGTPLHFVQDNPAVKKLERDNICPADGEAGDTYITDSFGEVTFSLTGDCQSLNFATICRAVDELRLSGVNIPDEAVRKGAAEVCRLTGLMGRWMTVSTDPLVICDTGHNVGGWQYLAPRLAAYGGKLLMVIGFVNDKDVSHILEMMPRDAEYFFTRASVPRALPENELAAKARDYGLTGNAFATVREAVTKAMETARRLPQAPLPPLIFVGGSNFIIADLLSPDGPLGGIGKIS